MTKGAIVRVMLLCRKLCECVTMSKSYKIYVNVFTSYVIVSESYVTVFSKCVTLFENYITVLWKLRLAHILGYIRLR